MKSHYLPGFEPDFEVRKELLFYNGILDLRQFDKIFVSVSGGKDSQAMLFSIADLASVQGVPKERFVVMYADTGMEWYNAQDHVRKLASAVGFELRVVFPNRPMIELFKFRLSQMSGRPDTSFFPSPSCRYCTTSQKIRPMDKLINSFSGKVLKVTGERWEESLLRSKYSEFVKIDRLTSKKRSVYGWRMILC